MSFVRNILSGKLGGGSDVVPSTKEEAADIEDEDDVSEGTTSSTDSADTGIFNSSDLESSGHAIDADCSAISNFFGYWKNLINQEAKFQSQLNELSKQLSQRDGEANKLRFQQEELQRDVFAKSAGMDRLQAELQAAHKESEYVKQRLRNLEDDLQEYRRKNGELSEELTNKNESYAKKETEAGTRINELERVIGELKVKIGSLEMQIEELQRDKRQLELQQEAILAEREKEKQLVEVALQEALKEKENVNKKWEEEFEKLRTVSILKEQQLLDDFEWKLREVEKTCKGRLIEKDKTVDVRIQEAYKDAEEKMKLAQEMMDEVEHLKECEMEMGELKDKSKQQEKSLEFLREQQEQMRLVEQSLKDEAKKLRSLIDLEKENLQHMQRVHNQEIIDKERWLQNTLDEKKTEIAVYWEERLLHEIGRLKYELEQLYFEEKQTAVENIRAQKEEEFQEAKKKWEEKVEECLADIAALKKTLDEKERTYHDDMVTQQTVTDRDILELRRIMDKIDDAHHERFEKLMMDNEKEIERINEEHDLRVKEVETSCQNQMSSLRTTLELVKEQMERESQQKIQSLIQQHRSELDAQWDNLIHQKSEAIKLVEDEYVNKYKTLEEQFYTQQKSHEAREVELLKSIDSLKNDVSSKSSTIDDLQNNVDVLEGGVQVLNQEIANQGEQLEKNRKDADQKIRGLQDVLIKLQALQAQEKDELQMKFNQQQKQYQTTIDHLQRKCTTLTKLFEEVRGRYERRDSRQEDLNLISDLRQVIAEQEKDMACMNEEKRFYQMKLLKLQRSMDGEGDDEEDDEDDELEEGFHTPPRFIPNQYTPPQPINNNNSNNCIISIPPTIPECDDCDEE
ncbi:PREDICTED: nucleoprotein TPR isoform X2 [Nicrophorus vespilloides]|uniref:Nucleoprotein TPR isoform X2 n=1 Tax=Nicrophorus vespilloides TaxID=110193 RepID=A0ABM1NFS0_NICVS|nr:PREDICTED: nucleoprotein TPR isoform X2 [Nicrophorus vespilloides]